MSRTAILYVTRTGHCRELATDLARKAGTTAHEIGDLVSRKGFLGFMRGGAQASRKAATPISDPGVDLGSVDTIVLVHPIWASNVCPPVRSWLEAHRPELAGKKLGLLVSCQGPDGGPVKEKFEAEFGPLAAFGVFPESIDAAEREGRLERFRSSMGI
jgi:hypothetical protein